MTDFEKEAERLRQLQVLRQLRARLASVDDPEKLQRISDELRARGIFRRQPEEEAQQLRGDIEQAPTVVPRQEPLLPTATLSSDEEAPNAAAYSEAKLFLEALFSTKTPGEIMIKTRASTGWRLSWHRLPSEAAERAINSAKTSDVYFGTGRRLERKDTGEAVAQYGFVWVDFDGKSDAEVDAFVERVTEAQLPPSIAVQTSTFALHCYWLLDRARESADVREVVAELAARFRGDAGVADAARILRIPGTTNFKPDRNRFRIRFYSGGGSWWCPTDGLDGLRRYALEDLGTVSGATRYHAPAWCPSDETRDLLDAIVGDVPGAKLKPYRGSVKVTLNCIFHDDQHSSAVVFANGHYFCSATACGVNEPASQWTRKRQAQRSWAERFRAERERRKQSSVEILNVGIAGDGLRAPRVGIQDVGKALLSQDAKMRSHLWIDAPGTQMRLGSPRSESSLSVVPFGDVCDELREQLPMAYRVLWASIVLAQITNESGIFPVTLPLLGRMLGYDAKNNALNDKPKRQIRDALSLLTHITANIQWSNATAASRARLLTPVSEETRGQLLYRTFILHPGIHKQVVGRSEAFGHLLPEALKLKPAQLAVYLEAQYRYRQRGRPELRFPLADVARAAGATLDLRTNRTRTLELWNGAFEGRSRLGLRVEVSTAELVIGPQAQLSVADVTPIQQVIRAVPRALMRGPDKVELP